jgi:indole-3-glycerol phosphate synthase
LPPPCGLQRSQEGFDLIAEVKRRAPSAGRLETGGPGGRERAVARAREYAAAGVAAVSVLTEPDRFDGSLEDLEAVARAVDVPVMRKDFLVDPYQVLEARLAGAAGVLLIARLLPDAALEDMTSTALDAGLFVLAEAFDRTDLDRIGEVAERLPAAGLDRFLVGLNARDLATLAVDRDRLRALAGSFPDGPVRVAESGIESSDHAAAAAREGYGMVLVGSALMRSPEPGALARRMLAAGRGARTAP